MVVQKSQGAGPVASRHASHSIASIDELPGDTQFDGSLGGSSTVSETQSVVTPDRFTYGPSLDEDDDSFGPSPVAADRIVMPLSARGDPKFM